MESSTHMYQRTLITFQEKIIYLILRYKNSGDTILVGDGTAHDWKQIQREKTSPQ